MSYLILTDKNFSEEVLKSQEIVLVDFWADWCFPCKMMEPVLEEIKNEFGDKIKIGKVNVDENPLIASSFMVNAIPVLILFKNGKIVEKFTGVQAKKVIEEAIKKIINEGD
ncbi:thioredoxin [bacterium]|nr:thioredoxin [bacterium]